MLDDARNMGETHFSERVGAVTSVVEDQPVLGMDGIEEIGTEADRQTNNAYERAGMRVALDMVGLETHRLQKPHIIGGRHKNKTVVTQAGPLGRRMGVVIGQTSAEDF